MAKARLKRVDALAVAFWHGLYSLTFALFIGVVYSNYTYIHYGRLPTYNLLFYMVGIPVVYCPVGFLAYGLVALIYNYIARNGGGIILEFESNEHDTPPPPHF